MITDDRRVRWECECVCILTMKMPGPKGFGPRHFRLLMDSTSKNLKPLFRRAWNRRTDSKVAKFYLSTVVLQAKEPFEFSQLDRWV